MARGAILAVLVLVGCAAAGEADDARGPDPLPVDEPSPPDATAPAVEPGLDGLPVAGPGALGRFERPGVADLGPARAYAGGWEIGDCWDAVEPTGDEVGDVLEDFALVDQHGETVHLHDFCDRTVLLATAGMWCGWCQDLAAEHEDWVQTWADDGFFVITLLHEDIDGQDPTVENLVEWADAFGLSTPVLADPGAEVTSRFLPSRGSPHSENLLLPGVELAIRNGEVTAAVIEDALYGE